MFHDIPSNVSVNVGKYRLQLSMVVLVLTFVTGTSHSCFDTRNSLHAARGRDGQAARAPGDAVLCQRISGEEETPQAP